MKASELTPNGHNPRTITNEQLEALRKAMAEFGDLSGVIFNRTTGNTVGGHQRLKVLAADASVTIAQTYKKPTRNGTIAEGYVTHEGERFVYREVKWDKTKEAAAMIAANKHGGSWDTPMLKEILSEIDTGAFDMSLTGFDEKELAALLTATAPPEEFGVANEDIAVEHRCPKCNYVWSGRA